MARLFKVGSRVARKDEPNNWGTIIDVMPDGGGVVDDDGEPCKVAYEVEWEDGPELTCGKYLMRA